MISKIINKLQSELPATVKLVAVSKYHPFEAIQEAYHAGQKCFGESRPQELLAKISRLEEIRTEKGDMNYMADVEWHFIGHLQTNKLKMVLPYVSMIHSVDSVRLLEAINNWSLVNNIVSDVLLEPHVAAEDSKQGFSKSELLEVLSHHSDYKAIRFRGIMGMATFTEDEAVIRQDFSAIRQIFDEALAADPTLVPDFNELSIGMSDDYRIAIEYGSTMVRIGSMIFGERNY